MIYNITFIKSLSIQYNTLQILTVQFLQLYTLFERVFTRFHHVIFKCPVLHVPKELTKKDKT